MAYRTSDLYYAAFLKMSGISLTCTEREGPKIFFIFDDSNPAKIKELKYSYFNRVASVPALTFSDEIKSMKTLISYV